jgi:hypothetical protein
MDGLERRMNKTAARRTIAPLYHRAAALGHHLLGEH